MPAPAIAWMRNDFRLADNAVLTLAAKGGRPVLPVFPFCSSGEGWSSIGAASRWWLHHSIGRFSTALADRGAPMILLHGAPADVLPRLAAAVGADEVIASRRFEPHARDEENAVRDVLAVRGVRAAYLNTSLLHDPDAIRTGSDKPYRVFTPFWKKVQAEVSDDRLYGAIPELNLSAPDQATLAAAKALPETVPLDELGLLPTIPWDAEFGTFWTPGEAGAHERLERFLDAVLGGYDDSRNVPSIDGTSALSPHLHFGEISPRQVARAVRDRLDDDPSVDVGAKSFLSEIGWREFGHHVLHHFPDTIDQPLNPKFERFPYREEAAELRRWQRGLTGYPIVDAGMRQLWRIGWMHNRVRMIVGSFLTKHLLQPWWKGAEWFWDTLVDADLAANTLGWQWIGGTGADAAPYFRVFNPITQGEKFDPDGAYIRRWVPELSRLPADVIHKPWTAKPIELAEAGIELGQTYPRPIVDHPEARQRALDALATLKT